MGKQQTLDAKTASEKVEVTTSPPGPSRPGESDGNAAVYGRGRRFADQIARHVARGVGPRAALHRVAADLGLDVTEVQSAVRFREAVDRIAVNAGPAVRRPLLRGGRHLSPERVMQIARMHPERQRYAMAQVAKNRHPFARPLPGVAPPFDTLGFGKVRSRIARSAGSLDWVASGLADTPPEGWPAVAKLVEVCHHLGAIREHCQSLRTELCEQSDRVVSSPTPEEAPVHLRRRSPKAPAPFHPGRVLATVAAVRGIAAKNLRDVPRLLRESPMTGDDHASLLDGLRRLDAATEGLIELIRGHISAGPPRSSSMRSGPPGRAAGAAGQSRGVRVEGSREGPSSLGGTYVVIFSLAAAATVTVGALGTFDFPAGYYGYVGSAFGPGGVQARTGRHLRRDIARKKWNIDHMKPPFSAVEVWWTNDPIRRECSWSAVLSTIPGFSCPAAGFGSHDCRVNRADGFGSPDGRLCRAHLYQTLEPPNVHEFARRLGRLVTGHATVYRQRLDRDEQGGFHLPSGGAA